MRSRVGIVIWFLLLACLVAGCSAPVDSGLSAKEPGTAQAANSGGLDVAAVRGKVIYQRNCLTCHGPGGKGDGPTAFQCSKPPSNLSDADVAGQSRRELFRRISNGGSGMPAFRRLLSEQDRLDVIEYVKTMASLHAARQQEADSHF
jgi:mono/diheme cytochrome c family protein